MINTISNETFKRINKLNNKKYRDEQSESFDVLLEGARLISQVYDNLSTENNKLWGAGRKLPTPLRQSEIATTKIKTIYCREDKFNQYRELISKIGCDVYLLTEKQSSILAETENEQGIYARIEFKTKQLDLNVKCKMKNETVKTIGDCPYKKFYYLNGISDPGNLGSIFRTASAFGVDGLILDEQCCDLANSKVIRASLGAVFTVPVLRVDNNWIFTRHEKIYITASRQEMNVKCKMENVKYDMEMPDTSLIIVIGSEAHGVADSIRKIADKQIYIPIQNEMESLNVSVAFGVLVWVMNYDLWNRE